MDADEFPIDANQRVIIFPVYLLQGTPGGGFACHDHSDGTSSIVLLTDEDALNRYRHDIGFPERGAEKFSTPQQLLAALQGLPPFVTGMYFDMMRRDPRQMVINARPMSIRLIREQLAAQIAPK